MRFEKVKSPHATLHCVVRMVCDGILQPLAACLPRWSVRSIRAVTSGSCIIVEEVHIADVNASLVGNCLDLAGHKCPGFPADKNMISDRCGPDRSRASSSGSHFAFFTPLVSTVRAHSRMFCRSLGKRNQVHATADPACGKQGSRQIQDPHRASDYE